MTRRGVAVVLAAALLAACSGSGEDPGAEGSTSMAPEATTATAPSTTTTTTPVFLPAAAPIDWSGCGGGFQCARITVPVDYTVSGGPTLELALIRRPAGDPARRIGTLVMNPGGPGSSGVRRVRRGFTVSAEVAERFDIVGFDPRGIGDSTPITCGATVAAFRAKDLAPDTPREQAELEAAAAAVALECGRTEGDRLTHLGTQEVVQDLEVLRRDLGEPQISFVGLSYGTQIGLEWAEDYPASVRAMVLDGVVDPAQGGDATSEEQIQAIDDTLTAVDQACRDDPTCPAAASGGLLVAYDELASRIEGGFGSDQGVGPTQLAYAAFYATYGIEHWARLWQAVADGLAGDLSGVTSMAQSFTSLVSYAPFAIVTCSDAPHLGPIGWRADATKAARRSARFGGVLANELLPCAFLPQSDARPHRITAPGTPAILVLGSTGDVATPYEQAERVARDLADGVLLTIDLAGHVALGASDCATAAATRYLVDLAVPAPGTRC